MTVGSIWLKSQYELVWYVDQHLENRSALIEQLLEQWRVNVNFVAGLTAYTDQPKKPALDLEFKGLAALPPAVF